MFNPDNHHLEAYRLPSYGIELTKEQYEIIKNKKAEIYDVSGQQLFEIRENTEPPYNHGTSTQRYMLYIVWK